MERHDAVTFKGNAMTLVGNEVKVGEMAPNFTAIGGDMKPVSLDDFKGQTVVISSVPSLDTPVCELQTKRFNQEVTKLDGVKILTISMDLPFAQNRFCAAHQIEGVQIVSDYKDRDFAQKYGLYIKELGLLARSVMVVGKDGRITYWEIVPEVAEQPNYDLAMEAARQAAQNA